MHVNKVENKNLSEHEKVLLLEQSKLVYFVPFVWYSLSQCLPETEVQRFVFCKESVSLVHHRLTGSDS